MIRDIRFIRILRSESALHFELNSFYVKSSLFQKIFWISSFYAKFATFRKILEQMQIEQNRMVSLTYELRETDINGKILEVLQENKPLKFVYGTGRLLPSFEANLLSLKSGDSFTFSLAANQAYGERREEMIIDVPMSVFENGGKVDENICRVGNEVPMTDGSGNPLYGTINEILEDAVKMDFNHPMAGVILFFSGRIIEVWEPSREELSSQSNACSGCNGHANSNCGETCS